MLYLSKYIYIYIAALLFFLRQRPEITILSQITHKPNKVKEKQCGTER